MIQDRLAGVFLFNRYGIVLALFPIVFCEVGCLLPYGICQVPFHVHRYHFTAPVLNILYSN